MKIRVMPKIGLDNSICLRFYSLHKLTLCNTRKLQRIITDKYLSYLNLFVDKFSPLLHIHLELYIWLWMVIWLSIGVFKIYFLTLIHFRLWRIWGNFTLNLSTVGQIVEDIKALFHPITESTVTHMRRNTNSVAHRLAWVGLSLSQSYEWNGSPPSVIIDFACRRTCKTIDS